MKNTGKLPMQKIKHTKNELKKQKDNLKRFEQYLPNLQLKKQQLQIEIIKIHKKMEECDKEIKTLFDGIHEWADVFAEKNNLKDLIQISHIHTKTINIAGLEIPAFDKLEFHHHEYNLATSPLWIDYGLNAVKKAAALEIQKKILLRQLEIIREELRVITQRVNLFEKVKIPETHNNIRRIRIFLGDMQTASVVTGKIAKDKIERKMELANA